MNVNVQNALIKAGIAAAGTILAGLIVTGVSKFVDRHFEAQDKMTAELEKIREATVINKNAAVDNHYTVLDIKKDTDNMRNAITNIEQKVQDIDNIKIQMKNIEGTAQINRQKIDQLYKAGVDWYGIREEDKKDGKRK